MKKFIGAALTGAALVAVSAASGLAQEPLKIGVTATLEGTYTVLGEDGMRGFEVALQEHNKMAGGRPLEVIVASTDASPDSAIRAVRKLVEQDKVDVVISPLSGDEGIAVKNYAKTQPQMTFINAASGAQETTFVDPSENFFRFNMDGAQWSAGLGNYAFNNKGWKKIATIGEDYSFVYTQVFGLVIEYCSAGGEVSERFWVPLGTKDFSSIIAALPDDVDAIYLGLGGGDAVNFLNQYAQAGGDAHFLGGSIMVDQTVLSSKGKAKELLVGTPAASGQADTWDNPKWQAFVKAYQDAFPPEKRFAGPSLLATNYYDAATAVFNALDQVNGDLSDGNKKFREALTNMVLDAPNGEIKLDENRQAIGTNFVTEVVEDKDGNLVSKVVEVVPNVNQTLGIPLDEFKKIGLPSRDVPECKKYK
jgi:ABC-type branched-subunit amino acid transport system substrate-binding protein